MVDASPEEPVSAGEHAAGQGKTHSSTRRIAAAHRPIVCPISRHPGFITTLERLLGDADFNVCPLRLETNPDRGPRLVKERPQPIELPRAAVFVLDLSSTNMETGALIERIRTEQPQARIAVVLETADDENVFPYLRLGVRGVVRYTDAENDLATAVKAIMSGEFWVQPKQLGRFVDWLLSAPAYRGTLNDPGGLSPREREVLVSVLSGLTNKEIASTLNISERTVKFHVSHLLQKLGAHRRADLIAKQHRLWPAIS